MPEDGFDSDDVTRVLINIEQPAAKLHDNTGSAEAMRSILGNVCDEPMYRLDRGIEALDTLAMSAVESHDSGNRDQLARAMLFFALTLREHFDKIEEGIEAAMAAGLSPAQKERKVEYERRRDLTEAEELGERVKTLLERAKAAA